MHYPRLQTKGVFLVNCHKINNIVRVGMMVLDGTISGEVEVISPDTKEKIKINIPFYQGCLFKQQLEVIV